MPPIRGAEGRSASSLSGGDRSARFSSRRTRRFYPAAYLACYPTCHSPVPPKPLSVPNWTMETLEVVGTSNTMYPRALSPCTPCHTLLDASVVAGLNILVAGGTQAGNPTSR